MFFWCFDVGNNEDQTRVCGNTKALNNLDLAMKFLHQEKDNEKDLINKTLTNVYLGAFFFLGKLNLSWDLEGKCFFVILNSAICYGINKCLLSSVKILKCYRGLLCVNKKYRSYNKSVFTDTYPIYLPGPRVKFSFQWDSTRLADNYTKLSSCDCNKVNVYL